MKFIPAAMAVGAVFFHFSTFADTVTNAFGFTGPEIYPIDQDIALLHVADLDGDGLNDIIVANNLRAKINLLYNMTGKTNRASANPLHKLELNELPPDSRFRIDSIPANERIAGMDVKDLNGDGRPDIVYYGDQKDLVVLYNLGTNGWSDPKVWHVDDGQMDPNALAVGDLTGDGLNDIVLLGDSGSAYLFEQQPDHTLAEPRKISYSGTPHAVQIVDVDGDGKNDLLLVDFDSPTPYRVRFQMADGQLGPEIYFKAQPIRSFSVDNLGGGPTNYLASIVQATGRAEVSQFTREPGEVLSGDFRAGQFQVLPLNKTAAGQRGILFKDVNGDGRPDLLVAEPESGQLSVYLQQADGTFAAPTKFPSLAGVSQIAVSDWNQDGQPAIFLLSRDENAVGITQFDKNGHLPFPTIIPLDGKPLIMATGVLKPGTKPVLAIIVDKDGARSLVIRTANGKIKTQKLSASFTSNPTTFAIQDVNQDGLADQVLLIPYEKVKVLLQKTDGTFDEEDVDPPGGAMDQPWLTSADLDGSGKPELLLPQKNFIRAVVLQQEAKTPGSTNPPDWIFSVKDQINGVDSDSLITGATAVTNGANATPSIFLLDS
ncbi:MAG: VCBS repeat-containing protein, partial [Verrucomicrobiota bacterium]